MDIISLKLDSKLLKEVDESLIKNRYSTRTEFIRDAIREKLADLEKDELLRKIAKSPEARAKVLKILGGKPTKK